MQRRLGSDQSHTPQTKVDALKASQIARRFLQQSYSTVTISNTLLEGNVWMITTNVGLTKDEIVQVKIDSKTGKIIDCWHVSKLKSEIPDESKSQIPDGWLPRGHIPARPWPGNIPPFSTNQWCLGPRVRQRNC